VRHIFFEKRNAEGDATRLSLLPVTCSVSPDTYDLIEFSKPALTYSGFPKAHAIFTGIAQFLRRTARASR
jgi:hypothetical protein